MSDRWPPDILKYVEENAMLLSDSKIADTLKRLTGQDYTENSVKLARIRLTGIKKRPRKSTNDGIVL